MDDNSEQSSRRQAVRAKDFYGGNSAAAVPLQAAPDTFRRSRASGAGPAAVDLLAMKLNNQVEEELRRRGDSRWVLAATLSDGWTGRYARPLGLSKAHISSREFGEWVHLVEQDQGKPIADLEREYRLWVSSQFPYLCKPEFEDRREEFWDTRFTLETYRGGSLATLSNESMSDRLFKREDWKKDNRRQRELDRLYARKGSASEFTDWVLNRGGGTRGKITGFSPASRGRAMREFAKINWHAVQGKVLCVDLTYPGEYSTAGPDWKRDLDVFDHRFRRKYPGVAFWWKLEPQRRGAPHFHLIVFGVEWIDKQWLSQAWYETVGSDDVRHLQAGTRVSAIHSRGGVVAYVCGCLTTENGKNAVPEWWKTSSAGRFWGWRGKGNVPIEPIVNALPYESWVVFRRLMYRCLRNHMKPKRWRQWRKRAGGRQGALAGGWGFIESATLEKMLDYVLLGLSVCGGPEAPLPF